MNIKEMIKQIRKINEVLDKVAKEVDKANDHMTLASINSFLKQFVREEVMNLQKRVELIKELFAEELNKYEEIGDVVYLSYPYVAKREMNENGERVSGFDLLTERLLNKIENIVKA